MNSLERRLQVVVFLSLLVLIVTFWYLGNREIAVHTEDFVISRLEHDAEGLLAALTIDPATGGLRLARVNPIFEQPLSGHYFLILMQNGDGLSSRSLWDFHLDVSMLQPGESSRMRIPGPAGQSLLVWTHGYHKAGRNITLAVVEDLSLIDRERDEFTRAFAILGFGGLFTLILVLTLALRSSFGRLDRIREDIRHLESGKTRKLSEDVPTEILPLVRELNQLLDLLTQRLERSRNALGNLAHAFKGPLNLLTQYLDEMREAPDAEKLGQAESQVERIRQLMERELKRARLAGKGMQVQRFDPEQEMHDLLGVLKQMHQKPLSIEYRTEGRVPPFGDREDMLELLGNLLDNACKWAAQQVVVKLRVAQQGIEISVEDDGQGLSEQDLHRLTERGTRLDETVEGHGLGLAIAKDIVKLYGGSLHFSRSEVLGGLLVRVMFPGP